VAVPAGACGTRVGVLTLSDDTRMLARPAASAQRSGWRRTPG
jgi:hypothetical protein